MTVRGLNAPASASTWVGRASVRGQAGLVLGTLFGKVDVQRGVAGAATTCGI